VNKAQNDVQKKRRGWWWKIPVGLLLLLFVALVIAVLNINSIAHGQINQALKRFFVEGGTLNAIDIHLKQGRIELTGLTINPPRGYGTDPLLALNSLELDIDPTSLFGGEIVVEQLVLNELSLILVRDKQGQLSPLKLLPPGEAVSEPEPTDDSAKQKPLSIPAIRVNSIRFNNLSVRLIDHLSGEQWSAGLRLDLDVEDLELKDLLNHNILAGKATLVLSDIKVDQPAGFSKMPLITIDKIELASAGIDLATNRLPVNKVLLDKLKVSVERNQDGLISLQKLFDTWMPTASDEKQQQKTASVQPSTDEKPETAAKVPTLVFEDIRLNSIAMQLLDHAQKKPWRAGFDNLDIKATALSVGDLAQQDISLDSFALDLKGIKVDQPAGFNNGKMAEIEQFKVITGGLDLASPEMVVKQVMIQGFASSVAVNKDGMSNVQSLNETLFGKTEETRESKAKPEVEKDVAAPEKVLPMVRFEQIKMEDGSLNYRNEALTEEALVFPLDNIRIEVAQLRLFNDNAKVDPASALVSLELGQSKNLPTAYFGGVAAIGPVDSGVPPVNSQVRLTGFKLDTLGSLIPPATRTTLGATGLDAGLTLALDSDTIRLETEILTDKNIYYEALRVKGPLDAPTVEMDAILAGVYSRVSEGLVNLGKQGLNVGVDIAEGGVDVAKEVGSGALKVGKNLGESFFEIGTGMLALDQQQLRKGLVGSTSDTFSLTMDSVSDAGSAADDGLKSSVSELTGDAMLQSWDERIPARHQAAMKQAQNALTKMPYPPVID
jgi:uncharacterized protein involved in outer membrane biogenesis